MTSIHPSGHRAEQIVPLPTLTEQLHKEVSQMYEILNYLDALRKDTTAEVRDAYTLVLKDLVWKLHQKHYNVQNQLIEQTMELEYRNAEIPRPRCCSPIRCPPLRCETLGASTPSDSTEDE